MHENLNEIKKLESSPRIIKKFLNTGEIDKFLKLYEELPVAVNNIKQKVIKQKY